jgi:hypothetical protein
MSFENAASTPSASLGRRDFLRIGAGALGGLALPDFLRLRAEGAVDPRAPAKAVIFVYLFGGPSHVDTYDMKPGAPSEYRGEFVPIQTNVAGFEICELMPMQAKIADKLALVRNMTFNPNFHDPVELLSGFRKPTEAGRAARPDIGSVVSRLRYGTTHDLPRYVALDKTVGEEFRNGPAYLGIAHKAFIPGDKIESLALTRGVSPQRLQDRAALLRGIDQMRRDMDSARGDLVAGDAFNRQALDMITSPKAREAFDFSREPGHIRARYGDGDATRLLQARRLVEAGVPVVTLTFGSRGGNGDCKFSWDTHEHNFICLRELLPRLDRAIYALITDLEERGLGRDVAVFVGGEMGRTPRVGQSTGNGSKPDGRDHWPRAGFALLAGGGLRTGQVIGKTDKYGAAAVVKPYTPQNVLATLYGVLGIDPATTLPNHSGRPMYLLDDRDRIAELV